MSRLKLATEITTIIVILIATYASATVYDDSRATAISGGENHTLLLTADANLWACGDNGWRQLGIGDDTTDQNLSVHVHGPNDVNFLENIITMDAGWKHSLAVDVNNHVWAFGNNEQGQLGDPDIIVYSGSPIQVKSGAQDPGHANTFLQNIIAVSAGRSGEHSLALDKSNHVWSFGRNDYGQLGDGTITTPRTTPVAVHAGQQNPENPNAALADIVQISAGEMTSIALEKIDANDPNYKGRVFTWGSNKWPIEAWYPSGKGKLGNGDITADSCDLPVLVLRGAQSGDSQYLERIVAVSAGWDHMMALEELDPFEPNCLGRVYTFGNNGQGYGNDQDPYSVGGRLSNGTYNDANVPVMVVAGQQYPAEPTSPLKNIVAISAGEAHSMALDYQGHVFCWGDNYFGQLGNGTTDPCTTPVQVIAADTNQPLSGIVAISAAYWHSLAIDDNGTIWSWGKHDFGSLGVGPTITDELFTAARTINLVQNLTKQSYQFGIQTAIDDANNGNVLEAQPGTYFENINFQEKTLTLTGTDPFDEDVVELTVIYGARYDPTYAATVNIQECTDSVLTGLTITNAYDAIVCDGSSAAITNCIVTNNKYRGIYSSNCDVNIINCLINHNDEQGIYCANGDVNVAWSVITDNIQDGIHTQWSPNINITNSIIAGNGGNGVFLEDCVFSFTAEVVNNWIYNNGTSSGGAGLDVYFSNVEVYDQAVVRNNTIVNNATYGINLLYAQDAIIDNCIVYNNGDSASDNIHKDGGAPFYVSFSCVEGSFTGTGNIDDDPCFADPNWTTDPNADNFHIGPNSLCIDVGKLNSTEPNETDIDGEDRVVFGRTALRVDMGADELYWPKCDYDRSEIVNFVDFTFFANAWKITNTTIDLDDDNFVDINDLVLFCSDWLWVAPWSARYEQMSKTPWGMDGGSGGRTMDTQTAIAAPTQAPGFMPGVHPTAPAQSEPLSAERIEELIEWTESLLEDEERTLDESKIQIILDSLKAELEN